ncbi:MAG: PAS domain S-box protein, partial [Ignavibacteria bacterium]
NMPLNTVEERRRAIKGWVYSPYRMNDLMMGILGRWEMQEDIGIHIHIYDGDSLSAETLLYESKSGDTTKLKETLRLTMPLEFNGKRWTLDFVKNDESSVVFTPVIFLLAGGILISILIYFLIISYVNTRRRAEVLSESEKQYKYLSNQLEAILDHIPGLVFYKDRNNNFIRINKYYADGHGKEKSELEGKNLFDIYPKEDAEKYYEDDLSVINSGQARLNIEEPWNTDGNRKWVSTSKIPFVDSNGEIIGIIGIALDITERKLAEELIRESEEKYRNLVELTKTGFLIMDSRGIVLEANDEYVRLSGHKSFSEIEGRSVLEWTAEYEKEKNIAAVEEVSRKGFINNFEIDYVDSGGHITPIEINGYVEGQGKEIRIISLCYDITKRKQAEIALRETESQYRDLANSGMALIWKSGTDMLCNYFNEPWLRFTGRTLEQEMGNGWTEGVHPDDMDFCMKTYDGAFEKREKFSMEYRLRNALGEYRWLLDMGTPYFKTDGEFTGYIGHCFDISELKHAEEQLKYLSTRLILATVAGGVGIWEWDIVNNVLMWDDQMYALYGIEKDKFSGVYEAWRSGLHPDDIERCDIDIQLALSNDKEFDSEFRNIWPDGSVHTIRALATVQRDATGKPLRMLGTNWDITEQKKAEAVLLIAMKEAETANKAKSRFLANMSHEIRTPLNAIIGFSQLLNRDKMLSESQKEYSVSIIRAGEHLLALINDILELSKVEAGRVSLRPVNVDLHTFLRDMQMIFKERASSKHIYIKFETDENLPRFAEVDESKLRQIFINLIGNAVKFTDEGGVEVHSRIEKGNDKTSRLIVEIRDTGPGISKDEMGNLFQHFVQTSAGIKKGSGTGLGLVLSRELAVLMGGNITVQSEAGKGSVFTLEVEIQETDNLALQNIPIKRVTCIEDDGKTYRILVVDDKKENMKVAVGILKIAGFATNEAVNGEDAIVKFKEWKPDLILMDMIMPVMDGYEATRLIKLTQEGKHTPIIALTASSFEEEQSRTSLTELAGYIRKPFRENDLFSTIGKVLGIKYIYEEDSTSEYESLYIGEDIRDDIAETDGRLLKQMTDAIDIADLDKLINLIKSIESVKPELSRQLMVLAKDYDYNKLRLILRKKDKE